MQNSEPKEYLDIITTQDADGMFCKFYVLNNQREHNDLAHGAFNRNNIVRSSAGRDNNEDDLREVAALIERDWKISPQNLKINCIDFLDSPLDLQSPAKPTTAVGRLAAQRAQSPVKEK